MDNMGRLFGSAPNLGSGHDLAVHELSGFVLTARSLEPVSDSVCVFLSALAYLRSVSLSLKINKY